MARFRQGSLKLKDNQRAYFGSNDSGSIYFDGTKVNVTSVSGVSIKLVPANAVVLDDMSFPTTDGTYGQVLTISSDGQLGWDDYE